MVAVSLKKNFFQAEDGIRDLIVTGVQTCALPIYTPLPAIADAVYNAIGTRFYELPITPEQIAMAVEETR